MKVVIIEDEVLIAEELTQLLNRHFPQVEIIATLSSIKQSSRWLQQHPVPDLFFMDIQLSDGVIFTLFDQFEITCPVIFTTAYSEYAIRAFKVNSIDYLLKPVDKESLEHALLKFSKNRAQFYPAAIQEVQRALSTPGLPFYKEKFLVAYRHHLIPVNTADIAWFRKEVLIYAHTFSGEEYILDNDSLEELESLLDPARFFRTNRQYIIHVNAVDHVIPHSTGKLSVVLLPAKQQQVDVSREKAVAFKKWLGG